MIIEGNNLRPEQGYKYITNGEVWSDWVILGIHDSTDNWHDTNDDPPTSSEPTDPPTDFEQGYDTAVEDILT